MQKIAVVGLGYVGLPLAVELAKRFEVLGFDISEKRVTDLKNGIDRTLEVASEELLKTKIRFSSEKKDLEWANFYIVTVPTPITNSNQPDLSPLTSASKMVGSVLKAGDIVVFESTVYPGCTEEVCVPLLEQLSGLKYEKDFFCGYSPERINPGDKLHTITKIQKVVSATNSQILDVVDSVYGAVIEAGTFRASSIKVAEAAKVIENTQRDINIAFVNELSLIFERMNLDTKEVLEAAATKWNFLKFYPGLVGGHCIGVDPYYLTYKAESLGYHPQMILAGRRINDGMGKHVANQVVKLMIKKDIIVNRSKVLILGVTFKENCPDIRNSRVIDIVRELAQFGCDVDIYDPMADANELLHEYGLKLCAEECLKNRELYSAIILSVAHEQFKDLKWSATDARKQVVFDVKGLLNKDFSDGRL